MNGTEIDLVTDGCRKLTANAGPRMSVSAAGSVAVAKATTTSCTLAIGSVYRAAADQIC